METKVTYVGLDVHRDSIVAEWSRVREAVSRMEVPNDEQGLKQLAARVGTTEVWGAYEASSCGFGLYDALTALGWKMSVLAPTHLERSPRDRKRKTDREDARRLREILVAHGEVGLRLPTVWIPDPETRADREVGRRRLKLGERLGAVKTCIRSLLTMHGVKRPEALKSAWTRKHVAWLRGLTEERSPLAPSVRVALASDLRELEFLEEEERRMQREVEALAQTARYKAPVERMRRVKGVGVITAMVFLLELGDPGRFHNRRQIGCFLGLVPTSYESGEADDRKGHITRMGPARVRKVLNQAAWCYLRENPDCRRWFLQARERRGAKRALVGVMRRLGILLWRQALAA